jgi:hypothetical protein
MHHASFQIVVIVSRLELEVEVEVGDYAPH